MHTAAALTVPAPSERLLALHRVRDRLLKQIGQKKKELGKANERLERSLDEIRTQVAPMRTERAELEEEVHRAFRDLLAGSDLPKRKRKVVLSLYRSLAEGGLLDRVDGDPPSHAPTSEVFDEGPPPPFGEPCGAGADAHGDTQGPHARHWAPQADASVRESLRALFKRLAMALHPDRVQQEDEIQRRTEAMKEVTRAYQEGDLARLLEIEKEQASLGGGASSAAPVDEKVSLLERVISDLKDQLTKLHGSLRSLKRSESYRMMQDIHRARALGVDPFAEALRDGRAELLVLESVRDHVRSFIAGKIGWAAFVEGPEQLRGHAEDQEILQELLQFLGSDLPSSQKPPKRRKRSSNRRPTYEDIPF
jgi:predicted  nucleic acid-binding Zn-ribbon protein